MMYHEKNGNLKIMYLRMNKIYICILYRSIYQMSSKENAAIMKSNSLNSSSQNSSSQNSNVVQLNQSQNTPSSPKKSMPPPSYIPPYLDDIGMIVPKLYYEQPFFTRRPKMVSRDVVLPNLNDDENNEYLIFPVHGEIGRLLSSGNLVNIPAVSPNSKGIKIEQPDEQRLINHYLRVIEISNPHESFSPLDTKSIYIKLHDKLTSSSKKRFFTESSQGKQDRQNFFKEIKPFLTNPDASVDTVHLVDITHDRKFSGHFDIRTFNHSSKINFELMSWRQEYMGLLKPIRPVEFDNPKITDIEKDALETYRLYSNSQWLGAPDGVNFERISLFDNILSLAQHLNKRLNIVIFSCSGPLDPYNITKPSTQLYFYKKTTNIERPLSMYKVPINILKTGCDFINRLKHILHRIISIRHYYTQFVHDPYYLNNDDVMKTMFNGITGFLDQIFSNDLFLSINTSEFSILYINSELLSFQHDGESIFESTIDIDDYELLIFATKVYLSEEMVKQLIGLIENVINIINTDILETTEYITQNKTSEIWKKTIPSLGLRNQVCNNQELVDFFSSVGQAAEYLFEHLLTFSNGYLKMLLIIFKTKKALINVAQTRLKTSKSRSKFENTIGSKAVKLMNERKVVFENLVKKHCSHHYKYKSRTPNDGIVKNRSTRSYRPESMRRKKIGKIRNDTDPLSPTSSAIRSAEEKRNADPLYAKRDTISRNRRVKKALQQLDEPLNDKIIGVLGRDQKERNMSNDRIERNEPGGVFMANRLHAFRNMLSKETRKKRVSSKGKVSRSSIKSRASRNRINHSV
jgi:hypothetical protein